MTEKDLRANYQKETGIYTPWLQGLRPNELDYVEWLEKQIIELERENYQMKLELIKPKERTHYA